MSDAETLSGDALSAAKGENANSSGGEGNTSGNENVSQAAVTPSDLQAFGQQLTEQLSQQLQEGLKANRQSQRDTIDDRVSKSVDTVQSRLIDTMKSMLPEGTDFRALERQAWIDSQMDTGQSPSGDTDDSPQASSSSSGNEPSPMVKEIRAILTSHGLSGDEPEIVDYVESNQGKPWWQVGSGLNELAGQIAARKQGDDASLLPGSGATGGTPPSPNLKNAYVKEVQALRAKGLSRREAGLKLDAIKERFEKQGLDTSQVNLVSEFIG